MCSDPECDRASLLRVLFWGRFGGGRGERAAKGRRARERARKTRECSRKRSIHYCFLSDRAALAWFQARAVTPARSVAAAARRRSPPATQGQRVEAAAYCHTAATLADIVLLTWHTPPVCARFAITNTPALLCADAAAKTSARPRPDDDDAMHGNTVCLSLTQLRRAMRPSSFGG
jgi:hypothetical protein